MGWWLDTLLGLRLLGRRWPVVLPAVILLWLSAWASGSRTAFVSALLVSLFATVAVLRALSVRPRMTLAACAVVLVALAVGATAISRSHSSVIGPFARFSEMAQRGEAVSPAAFVEAMWRRDGYGLAASRMIARYPAFGVGVGAFHDMAPEFVGSLPADNAQNWFRHQLAETGIVGSLGSIVFVLSFGWWVVRPHRNEPPTAWAARGMLIALVLVSLVGMPGRIQRSRSRCGRWPRGTC